MTEPTDERPAEARDIARKTIARAHTSLEALRDRQMPHYDGMAMAQFRIDTADHIDRALARGSSRRKANGESTGRS